MDNLGVIFGFRSVFGEASGACASLAAASSEFFAMADAKILEILAPSALYHPSPDRRAGRGRTMRMDPLFFRDSESEDNRGDQLSPGCPRVGSSRYLVGGVQDRVDDTRESTTVLVEQSQNSELNQGPQLGNADQVDFQVDGMDSGGKSPPCGSQDFLPRSSASLSEGLTLPYPHSLTCLPRSPSASLSSASLAAVSSPSRSPESSYLALNLRSNWGFN